MYAATTCPPCSYAPFLCRNAVPGVPSFVLAKVSVLVSLLARLYRYRYRYQFSYCQETKRRCGFFLNVFGLTLPEYLDCNLFPESPDPDVCIGHNEVKEAKLKSERPGKCEHFVKKIAHIYISFNRVHKHEHVTLHEFQIQVNGNTYSKLLIK